MNQCFLKKKNESKTDNIIQAKAQKPKQANMVNYQLLLIQFPPIHY